MIYSIIYLFTIHLSFLIREKSILLQFSTKCSCHVLIFQAVGGSGEYMWSVTDAGIASVSVKGQITTVGPGESNVTAADAKNSAHFGVSTVSH